MQECTKVFGAMPLIMLWPLLALVFELVRVRVRGQG